ncbi:hypothetical protein [Paraliomyxa miuraensis]|uniref:hypothetical protein n=1 Tax=Paraliomyxa miuraensis TaxID=376150 RepID=UPI00224D6A38|nr:hypothetical protein [Paraliomyxa miuraensis]MCX4240117.1 hypothetical protein [Paraliomyxa miuraensis]
MRRRSRLLGLSLAALLLPACPDEVSQLEPTGSESSTSVASTGLATATSQGSTSSGVVDDTGTSSSSSAGDTAGSQDCCAPHDAVGCEDPDLTTCVCNEIAFCCAFEWDETCVEQALACGGCGAQTTTDTTGAPEPVCCSASDQPGCAEDPALEGCVCGLDAFCCDQQWDDQCVQTAIRQCAAECGGGADACCVPSGSPGCPEDPMLEGCVCAIDPFCCDEQWDGQCVEIANDDCNAECTPVGGGDCCMANGSPGCDDMMVQDCVCAIDGYCCDTDWDGICVNEAQYECMIDCGLPPANEGDCCVETPGPGCDDPVVTDCTCMLDDGCCLFPWDAGCVQLAVTTCGITCPGVDPLPPCCLPQMAPGCIDMPVQDCVCAFDPFCCDTQWDDICVDEAQMDCMLDCGGGGGGGGTGGSTT